MIRVRLLPLLLITSGLLFSCGPKTKITVEWSPPEVEVEPFSKVMAIVMSEDSLLGRIAEDEFVSHLDGRTQGITGYSLIPGDKRGDTEEVKQIVKASGVDGGVVFRLVGRDTNLEYTPGMAHYSFWGYYGWGWSTVRTPGYLKAEKIIQIEAGVYDVASEQLIWSALSETTDPKSARSVIEDVARLVAERMKKMGLVG